MQDSESVLLIVLRRQWALWNLHTEDGILAVVGIGLLGGLELIELQYIINEVLLAGGWSAGWVMTLR